MLFNSFFFLLVFLPVVVLGSFALAARSTSLAVCWIACASLAFYGWWNPIYLLLLCASILFNYVSARAILHLNSKNLRFLCSAVLTVSIATDLSLLGYYKYANFFIENYYYFVAATELHLNPLVLPLGISFFTFTQISLLVDIRRGEVETIDPLSFLLFVTYFPHLIAGPILHHSDMMPQFSNPNSFRFNKENFASGLTIFVIGLFKKTVIADSIAKFSDPVFATAIAWPPTLFEAWGGALAYTLQIYFDFSGYSDMAVGLSLLFGIRIPKNFDSPYKAISIVDFWRRWHISLSNFLRDYLYVPMGGNRRGKARRYANLIVTMLIGGLWHGAGWTFVAWGGLHGAYLIVNHVWNAMFTSSPTTKTSMATMIASRLLTFLAVVVAWVFFRAESFQAAVSILRGMIGFNGVALPLGWQPALGSFGQFLMAHDVRIELLPRFGGARQIAFTAILLSIVWLAPNGFQWMESQNMALGRKSELLTGIWKRWTWKPDFLNAILVGCAFSYAVIAMYLCSGSEFIYYNF